MRIAVIFLCLLLALAAVSGCEKSEAQPQQQAAAPPAVPVAVAAAVRKAMPLEAGVIGTVEAYSTVAVRAQITGELTSVNFQQGDDVQAGQELFTLDRRPLEAALQQAQANLERDTAQAANAKAIMRALRAAGRARHRRRASSATPREPAVAALEAHARRRSRRGRERQGAAAVRHHPRADLRPHRRADGQRRQPGARQRSDAARHHQSGHADLRVVCVPGARCCRTCGATWRSGSLRVEARPASGDGPSRRRHASPSSTTPSIRPPARSRSRARFRNDESPALARAVRQRRGPADDRVRGDRRADAGRADRPGRVSTSTSSSRIRPWSCGPSPWRAWPAPRP